MSNIDWEEEERFFNALLHDPESKYHGFKLVNIYLCRYVPTEDQLRKLEEAGAVIDPYVCVRNYRHGLVEYLIKEKRLNPDDHIHDICINPYYRDRHEDFLLTLKVLVDYGANLEGLDSQNRTPLECLQSNRSLRWIGETYIRGVIKKRQKALMEVEKTKLSRYYLVDKDY